MRTSVIMGAVMLGLLAGCGAVSDSRLNPLNWFGRSEKVEPVITEVAGDPRPLVTQIIDLRLERVPGGAIIRATGLPERQGFFDGELVAANRGVPEDGILGYQFRVSAPEGATAPGTPQSREMIVGLFVSDQTLAGVRRIQVNAAQNALAVSR